MSIEIRPIVGVSLRRWRIALLCLEFPEVVGLGKHQVTQKMELVEPSAVLAIMSDLLMSIVRTQGILHAARGAAFRLQRVVAWEIRQV